MGVEVTVGSWGNEWGLLVGMVDGWGYGGNWMNGIEGSDREVGGWMDGWTSHTLTGPKKGRCECSACVCTEEYSGHNCGCAKSQEGCRASDGVLSHPSIHSSIHSFSHLLIHSSIHLFIHSFIYSSIHPSFHSPIHLATPSSIHSSIFSSELSINPFTYFLYIFD